MSKDVRMVASDTSKAPGPFLPKRAKSAPSPCSMKRSQTSFNLLDDAQKAHDESRTLGRRQLKILIGTTVAEAFSTVDLPQKFIKIIESQIQVCMQNRMAAYSFQVVPICLVYLAVSCFVCYWLATTFFFSGSSEI